MTQKQKLQIGVSSCLLGNAVRYDGKHKYNTHIVDGLGQHFTLTPFCPETGIGMSIPRPPIHLVLLNGQTYACDKQDIKLNYTKELSSFTDSNVIKIAKLSGFILQNKSPSCGLGSVKVHNKSLELLHTNGNGIFADGLRQHFPKLPIIEADKLKHQSERQVFINDVMAYSCDK